MGYCTVPDVQALRPQHLITATSKPNTAQVEQMIENLSAQVDGRVCQLGYITPVTSGATSLRYLRSMVSFGVAGLIEDTQRAGIAGESSGANAVRSNLWTIYEQMLQALVETPGILCDAPEQTGIGGGGNFPIESYFTNNPSDDAQVGQSGLLGVTAQPRFAIRKEF